MSEQISEAFIEIVELAARKGFERIDRFAGCWEVDVDGTWWFAVNAHPGGAVECSHGMEVQPFHAYIEYNGFPAGIISPGGGVIAAGEAANEDTFVAALRSA